MSFDLMRSWTLQVTVTRPDGSRFTRPATVRAISESKAKALAVAAVAREYPRSGHTFEAEVTLA